MTTQAPIVEPLRDEQLKEIQELYDRGRALSAYQLGIAHAPLALWSPSGAQVLAGRLAAVLGNTRLAMWLHRRAYRAAPHSAEACYFYGNTVANLKGPYAAWRWFQKTELPADASADVRSSWYALAGSILVALRDLESANQWMAKARDTDPTSAWALVCESSLREAEDQYDDALAVVETALAVRPWYRPAVQSKAHLLTLLGRDAEALALLAEANSRFESGIVAAQQFAVEMEQRDYEAASRSLDRFEEYSPLLEKQGRKWLCWQRAEVAYQRGDLAAAIEFGRQSDEDYWKKIVARLENPEAASGKHKRLDVGFVRQHRTTCVPATLTAISRYWSMPADHLQVAEEICYNGTSHYNERKWAREHGWIAREFSVTDASAEKLIDRGIPFTFTTIDPNNAHLQAIIGYDDRRGTLSVRDPYFRNSGEAVASELLDRYRAHGPRGMVLVPAAQTERLEGLALPDDKLWDALHELDGALIRHDRVAAGNVAAHMQADAPDHRLTIEGRRRLASYDGNVAEHLAAATLLAEQFPKNQFWQHARLALMRDQSRRDERLAIYERLLGEKDTHPIFWQQYAQELQPDARRHAEAIWRLRRAIRRWPSEPDNYHTLANIFWDHRRFDEALELYRFAACLGERNESYIESYFRATCWFKTSEQVLSFLRDRATRDAKQSSRPAMSLAWALSELERAPEAFAVLDAAMAARPDDGELMVYAADLLFGASTENLPKARALLDSTRDKAPRDQWLRTSAKLERAGGRLAEALACWKQVLDIQPLAIDAQRAAARLLAEIDSPAVAIGHLAEAAQRLPHFYPLHQLWVEWVREEPADVREPVLRRVAETFPHDAWVQRELGYFLAEARRFDEAREAAELAERLEPASPSLPRLKALLLQHDGREAEARGVLEAAIRDFVDNDQAIRGLMELCQARDERRAALALIKQELTRQVTFGGGLLSYREQARGTLESEELLQLLTDALASRPDLWQAWSAVVQQYMAMDRLENAWQTVHEATQRFPLLAQLRLDRADVCRARHDHDGELEALQAAYRIAPRWNSVVSSLANCLERRGEYTQARELLEPAVKRDPLDGMLRGTWAEALWRNGQREAAVEQLQRLVQLDPGYDRAWRLLGDWSAELSRPDIAVQSVRELTQRRGGESQSWMILAELLNRPEDLDERLKALDRAVELSPRNVQAMDLRAVILAEAARWSEALAACHSAAFGDHQPAALSWRAAWIETKRGDFSAAIERLKAFVADEPNNYGGWSLLADCYSHVGNNKGYLEAAEALVRISPQYEISHGYLAEARQRNKDLQGAEEAYRRAFTLNPRYEFAGNGLFDLQVECGDLAAADETIKRLRAHGAGQYVLARETRLAVLLNDIPRAEELIFQMATGATPQPGALRGAIHSLIEALHADKALAALERAVEGNQANAEAVQQWVALRFQRKRKDLEARVLDLLSENRPLGERAVYGYVEALARANDSYTLHRFIRRNELSLKKTDATWGAVAFALTALRNYRSCLRWVEDWRGRTEAAPWMLVNVVEGLRAMYRIEEARSATARALSKPADHGTTLHCIWLAADAAAEGDIATARRMIANVDGGALDADYQFLLTCVQAVLDLAAAEPKHEAVVFRSAMTRMRTARGQYAAFVKEPERKRIFRRCLRQLGRQRGTWFAKWVCWSEWFLTI